MIPSGSQTAEFRRRFAKGRMVALEDPDAWGRLGCGLRTVTVLIPLIYNPNKLGIRLPVGFGKIWRTIGEIKRNFSGFIPSLSLGWCKEDGIWDLHLRVEIDTVITPDEEVELRRWKEVLRDRFRQSGLPGNLYHGDC